MESTPLWQRSYIQILVALVLLSAIGALVAYANLAIQTAKGVDTGLATIVVSGEGKVQAVPNIGQFSFSVTAEATSSTDAQQKSATAINAITDYLKGAGVAETDIKTQDYNLSPKYTYERTICPVGSYCPPGNQKLAGYTVSETIVVKVRKLDQAGTLIAGVTGKGATNVSGLSFTIDDPTAVQAEARTKAITDAKTKAVALAKELGMKLGKITSFSENNNTPGPIMYAAKSEAVGMGGAVAPDLPTGQNEITSDVNITYQLR